MPNEMFSLLYGGVFHSLLRAKISPKVAIKRCFRRLPETEQVALGLRYWGASTIEEISEALEISWDDADQLLAAGEAALKIELLRELNIRASPTRGPSNEEKIRVQSSP